MYRPLQPDGNDGNCMDCVETSKGLWNNVRFELLRICFLFYVDLALDVQAIVIFISSGKSDFALLNFLAIMASSAYAFTEMRSSRPPKEKEEKG